MNAPVETTPRFSWLTPMWFIGSLLMSLIVAWIAVWAQTVGFAPVVLGSLITGAAMGGTCWLVAQLATPPGFALTRVRGAALGLIVAGAEHVAAYRFFCLHYEMERQQNAHAAFIQHELPSFAEYMRLEAVEGQLWIWVADAALIVLAAIVVVHLALPRQQMEPRQQLDESQHT